MYQPKKYKKEDKDEIFEFIKNHPFVTLIINGERLLATHIPVLTKGNPKNFRLYGHIANHNPQFKLLKENVEALLIFQGAHAYISSSWYRKKDISTWDYSAVHVNVKLKLQTQDELKNSLRELVLEFEENQENPLFYEDIPQSILEEHLPLITGFWCDPFKIEAISKLHQGYGQEDIASVTRHLEAQKDPLAAKVSRDIQLKNPDFGIKKIEKQSGAAFVLKRGQKLKVLDPEGGQVSDMVLFNADDLREKISSGKTLDFEENILLSKGNFLWSNRSQKMMEILEDTNGRNDFLLAPCSPETFKIMYKNDQYHPSCFENLYKNLVPFGIERDEIPTAFNIFMNVQFSPEGKLSVRPPMSQAGDFVIFEAKMDLVVGLTACSAEDSNGGTFKPIHFSILT